MYGGRAVLKGTRTPVLLIAELYDREPNAAAVLRELAHLDPVLVMAGITYYLANKALIDAELEDDQRAYDEAAASHARTSDAGESAG